MNILGKFLFFGQNRTQIKQMYNGNPKFSAKKNNEMKKRKKNKMMFLLLSQYQIGSELFKKGDISTSSKFLETRQKNFFHIFKIEI